MFLFLTIILLFSYFSTLLIIQIAVRKNILDIPNYRSSHSLPTPRGGGIAFVAAWYIGLTYLWLQNIIEASVYLSFLAALVLAFVSFLDDISSIRPVIRLIVQLLTAIAGIIILGGIRGSETMEFRNILSSLIPIVAVISIIWFINLFNFLDGIDGYASVQAIVTALGAFIVTGNILMLLLISAVTGFLIWNWPKAKIFMGDIGSTQLGYILAISALYFNNTGEMSIAGWLMLSSLFWLDATVTLARRFFNREKLSVAHRKHFYQRLVRYGFSHSKVLFLQIILSAVCVGLVLFSENTPQAYYITFPGYIAILIAAGLYIDKKYPFKKD